MAEKKELMPMWGRLLGPSSTHVELWLGRNVLLEPYLECYLTIQKQDVQEHLLRGGRSRCQTQKTAC